MLKILLCGASDTEDVVDAFTDVSVSLGGEPWHYQSGRISYRNTATASWIKNSRRTVANADLCVFVLLRRYGEITWNTELRAALNSGKPFLLLCLESTRAEYLALTRNVTSHAIPDDDKRLLVETLTELESDRQLTLATFNFDTFKDVYRREASKLFGEALEALSMRARREGLVALLGDPAQLTRADLLASEELAVDEFEEKNYRKLAVSALAARGGAGDDCVLALLASREQGVQRYAIANLHRLYIKRPADADFLDECVTIGLFAIEGVVGVSPTWAWRCPDGGRGLPRMKVPTPLIRKTSTCPTLPLPLRSALLT